MAYTKPLEDRIRENTKIQLTDLFGKARIRKQMWEYDCMLSNKNKQIAWLKDITVNQAEAVTAMILRTQKLEKENEMLREAIKKSDEVRKDLSKKLSISESEKVSLEMDYLNLKNKIAMEDAS